MRSVNVFFLNREIPVEYSIVGDGIPVLVMHGGHSNCNEEFGYSELMERGYSLITPSRAGYGETTREIGGSLGAACKAYVALLNHLKLEKVHVIAISAGGPSGIYFAMHYPERVRSLILQSAVSKEWLTPKDKEYRAAQIMFRSSREKYMWRLLGWMCNMSPEFMFRQMASSFSKLTYKQILQQIEADDLNKFRKMMNRQRSGQGFMIDLSQTKTITSLDLQAIQCPTLIMHSKNDNAVPVEHAYHAHHNIPNAELCILDSWGHLIWLGREAEKVNHVCTEFMCTY